MRGLAFAATNLPSPLTGFVGGTREVSSLHRLLESERHAFAVAAICQRLDGLPLAIELDASRMRVLSPEEIAERLDDRLALLVGGSRLVSEREQTLRATLE